jgi:ABC-type glycerol-3-phosphate transport system substrate-binding protein
VFFAPQQAHLGCAFYNPVLLKKIGAPAPDYEDFEGQMRWLLDLQAKWKNATGKTSPCINTHETFLMLGETGRKALVDWLKDRDEDMPPALYERLKRIHAMLSLAVAPKDHDDVVGAYVPMFNKGEVPVVFARTSGLRDVFHVNGFEPGCHPCFDTDDEIASVETGFVVRRDQGHAADALRFAEFLAKPEMQQLLPKHGMVPLQADLFTAGDAPSLWKKSRTTWFHTKEERSIWYSIIEPECSRWHRGETDFATFQADCRHLARMTLLQG